MNANIREMKKAGDWIKIEEQYPWGEYEEEQIKKWCEESWSYLARRKKSVNQSEENALKVRFGEDWVKKVRGDVDANPASTDFAASAASVNQDDKNQPSGSGWDKNAQSAQNQQPATNQGQGAQGHG